MARNRDKKTQPRVDESLIGKTCRSSAPTPVVRSAEEDTQKFLQLLKKLPLVDDPFRDDFPAVRKEVVYGDLKTCIKRDQEIDHQKFLLWQEYQISEGKRDRIGYTFCSMKKKTPPAPYTPKSSPSTSSPTIDTIDTPVKQRLGHVIITIDDDDASDSNCVY